MTLTMNPAVDVSTAVERIVPFSKLRCAAVRRDHPDNVERLLPDVVVREA